MPALAVRPRMPKPDDPGILARVAQAIQDGHPIATTAQLAGIGEMTVRDWLHAGEAWLNAHPDAQPQELGSHALFAYTIKQAEARFVDENLQYVRGARAPDAKGWLPAMTLLERRRPQDFGRSDKRQVEQRTLTISVTAQLSAGQAQALLEVLGHDPQALLMSPPSEAASET